MAEQSRERVEEYLFKCHPSRESSGLPFNLKQLQQTVCELEMRLFPRLLASLLATSRHIFGSHKKFIFQVCAGELLVKVGIH